MARIEDELSGFGTSDEQEAELERLQDEARKVALELREHYQQRISVLHGKQHVVAPAESALKKSKYKECSRRQVSNGILKSKKKTLKVISLKSREPKTFEEYFKQGLILNKLFKEPCFPPRSRLQLTKQQYRTLQKLRSQHEEND